MSPIQFNALHQMMRLRSRPALAKAIRLVLVDGLPQYEACAKTGVKRTTLCCALKSAMRVMRLSATLITGEQYVQS